MAESARWPQMSRPKAIGVPLQMAFEVRQIGIFSSAARLLVSAKNRG